MYINDEHEQDNSAVTQLIEMLISKKITGAMLFAVHSGPAVDTKSKKKKTGRAVKETAAMASLEGDEDQDDWGTEDDEARPPTILEVRACVRRVFTDYFGHKTEVYAFLRGEIPMRVVLEPTASRYVEGSREFELGELISESFYADLVKGSLDLTKLQDHTFDAFCKVVHKLAAEGFRAHVKTTKQRMQKALTTKAKSKSHLMKTAKKKAAIVKAEQPAYDNSHNHGFRGRINQRVIDSMQTKKPDTRAARLGKAEDDRDAIGEELY